MEVDLAEDSLSHGRLEDIWLVVSSISQDLETQIGVSSIVRCHAGRLGYAPCRGLFLVCEVGRLESRI